METRKIRGDCPDGRTCPAVYDTDGEVLLIQGSAVTDPAVLAQLGLGAGEAAVAIPRALLPEVRGDVDRGSAR